MIPQEADQTHRVWVSCGRIIRLLHKTVIGLREHDRLFCFFLSVCQSRFALRVTKSKAATERIFARLDGKIDVYKDPY